MTVKSVGWTGASVGGGGVFIDNDVFCTTRYSERQMDALLIQISPRPLSATDFGSRLQVPGSQIVISVYFRFDIDKEPTVDDMVDELGPSRAHFGPGTI